MKIEDSFSEEVIRKIKERLDKNKVISSEKTVDEES